MPINYRQRAALLRKAGFNDDEISEFARQYSVAQMRSLPYMVRMRRWRYLYATNMASKGYGDDEIQRAIRDLYAKKGWITQGGQPDPWQMLKSFRKIAIANNEYIPKKRPHRSRAEITRADVRAQAKQRQIQADIDRDVFGR